MIVLVRHGRSAHVVQGLLDIAAFRRWRDAYEAAGINDSAPPELQEIAQRATLVSSDLRRAIESAHLLAPEHDLITSPLLREMRLEVLHIPLIRLPLIGWAVTVGVRSIFHGYATKEEQQRARDAAQWLIELGAASDVVAVTHASFRALLAKELTARGWKSTTERRNRRHWSAWTFTSPARHPSSRS